MLLGILSDTHDHLKRTAAGVALLREHGAEALIHCGDLTGPDVVYLCSGGPCWFVFGNNEDEFAAIRTAIAGIGGTCLEWGDEVTLGGKRVAVTHGHLTREMRRLGAAAPDYLLFGHSHVATDFREGPTRFINPGALHRAPEYSVALLDLNTDALRFLPLG
jgi:putative phosphoesterase